MLRWSDVDLKGRVVYNRRTLQLEGEEPVGKSAGSLAPVQLQQVAVEALQSLPRPLDGNALVFLNPDGNVWEKRTFHKHYRTKALEAAGGRTAGRARCDTRSPRSRSRPARRSSGSASSSGNRAWRSRGVTASAGYPPRTTAGIAVLDRFAAAETDGNRTDEAAIWLNHAAGETSPRGVADTPAASVARIQ